MEYLLDRKIKKIDYLMISHFDSDHSKISSEIIEKLNVKNIIISKQFESTEEFEKTIKSAKKNKVNIIMVKEGDIITIDKNTYFKILWPKSSGSSYIKENAINNNSIVAKLCYKDFSVLFTGDIEEAAEKEILDRYNEETLKSNILKVAHHGSKSSSIEEFINTVQPQIALIGVGENNKFGHPNNNVLERLNNINCKVYRTDENGEITIEVRKRGVKVKKVIK